MIQHDKHKENPNISPQYNCKKVNTNSVCSSNIKKNSSESLTKHYRSLDYSAVVSITEIFDKKVKRKMHIHTSCIIQLKKLLNIQPLPTKTTHQLQLASINIQEKLIYIFGRGMHVLAQQLYYIKP